MGQTLVIILFYIGGDRGPERARDAARSHEKSEAGLLSGLCSPERAHLWPLALCRSAQEGDEGQGQDKDGCVLVLGGETEARSHSALCPGRGCIDAGPLGLCFCHKRCGTRATAPGVGGSDGSSGGSGLKPRDLDRGVRRGREETLLTLSSAPRHDP